MSDSRRSSDDAGWTHEPEFGERIPGRAYPSRPGVYAVLWNAARDRVAVVETGEGWFLPGGGIEAGETEEQALRREIAEELALAVDDPRLLGRAVEHVYVRAEDRCFRKEGSFYAAAAGAALARAPEADHRLHWLEPSEAAACLTHASQSWVLDRIVAARARASGTA